MGRDSDLLQAVRTQDTDSLQKLLCKQRTPSKTKLIGTTKKINVNYQDQDGMTALHQAALMGDVSVMKMLIDSHAHLDIKDNKGMRPIHYAAWQGKELHAVSLLLEGGSDPNEPANNGVTPLHLASEHGHHQVVTQLLNHHGDPTITNGNHRTPLDLACEFGRCRVVELLIRSKQCNELLVADPREDMADNNRSTCLHLAAKNGHIDIIKLLLQAGVDINRQTLRGTCLHEAALCGKIEVVRLLLDCGVDVNKTNSYDQTALDIVNKFTGTRAAKELKQLLREASYVVQARAIREYTPTMHDPNHITLKEGDVLTVLEQHPSGMWKGYISRADGQVTKTGYFPASAVVLVDSQDSDRDSGISPQQSYPSQTFSQSSFPGRQPSPNSPAERTAEWLGRYVGESDTTRAGSPSRDSPVGSNRNSTSSSNGPHPYMTPGLPASHRLSGQSYESGVSGVSAASRQSYHSNSSSSSLGSLDRLEESGYSSTVNVHELVQSGLADEEILRAWLNDLHHDEYYELFINAGYDMPTISHMTPQDLAAIGISNPKHRKRLKAEINKLNIHDGFPEQKMEDIGDWLHELGLDQYYDRLYCECHTMDGVLGIEFEDLEEIGITKLGHQKKLQLAIERIKRGPSSNKRMSSLERKGSADMLDSSGYHSAKWLGMDAKYAMRKSASGDNLYSGPLELTTFQQPKDERPMGQSWPAPKPAPPSGHKDVVAIQVQRTSSLHGRDDRPNEPPPPYSFYEERQESTPVDGDATPTNERRRIPCNEEGTATIRRPSAKVSPRIAPKPVAKIMAKSKRISHEIDDMIIKPLPGDGYQQSVDASSGSTAYSCSTLPRKFTRSHKEHIYDQPLPSYQSTVDYPEGQRPNGDPGSPAQYSGSPWSKGRKAPPPPPKRTNSIKCNMNHVGQDSDNTDEEPKYSNCVQSLAQRFHSKQQADSSGRKPLDPRGPQSCGSAPASDMDSFPPPPPDISPQVSSLATVETSYQSSGSYLEQSNYGSSVRASANNYSYESSDNPLNDVIQQLEKVSTPLNKPAAPPKPATAPKPAIKPDKEVHLGDWQDTEQTDSGEDSDAGSSCVQPPSNANATSAATGTDTLPFANENVGTIKQRHNPNAAKPSIVNVSEDGGADNESSTRNVTLNQGMFDEGSATIRRSTKAPTGECKKVAPPVAPKRKDGQAVCEKRGAGADESGDVLNDIDNMLQDLTNELDAMLELEMTL